VLIDDFVSTYYDLLASLAQAWLVSGAQKMSIWADGRLIAEWPAHQGTVGSELSVAIRLGRAAIGELRIAGLASSPQTQARLQADAGLIGQLVRGNAEAEALSSDLVETQDQLLALYQLNRSTSSALHHEESLHLLAIEAARLLKADAVFVYLAITQGTTLTYRVDGSPGPSLPEELYAQQGAIRTAREQVLSSEECPDLVKAGMRSMALIPISLRGTVIAGTLGLLRGAGPSFRSPELKLGHAIADHAAAMIERGLLYQNQISQMRMETEMELARSVQRNLLPLQAPTVAGLDIFALAIPARHVGGDLYDFIPAPDGSLIFNFGDVTGKGLAAALLMAMTRTALRSKAAFLPHPDPLMILTRANQDLYEDFSQVEMFATIMVGRVEIDEQRISLANAGHAPVIVHQAGAAPRLLEATGVPLGVLPDPLADLQSERFAVGDLLLVASDGLTEAQAKDGEMYGIERLLTLLDHHAGKSAKAIGQAIFDAVAAFSQGQPQSDDQTLIVMRRTELQ
jgi:phosphoserine phosphatase RsbU/P